MSKGELWKMIESFIESTNNYVQVFEMTLVRLSCDLLNWVCEELNWLNSNQRR